MGDADAPGAAEGDGDQAERDRQAVAAQQRRAPEAREALQHHRVNASLDQFNRRVGRRDLDHDRYHVDQECRREGAAASREHEAPLGQVLVGWNQHA